MTKIELIQCIQYLVPGTLEISGFTVAVDSSGNATIATWLAEGTQPTTDTLTNALTAIQLAAAQQTQVTALQSSYAASGYAPVAYLGASFPSDPSTLLLLSCTLIQGSTPQGLPSGFKWFDTTGTGVGMTLVQLQGLGNAIFGQVYPAFVKLQGLIAQVYVASTITAVQAVVWS